MAEAGTWDLVGVHDGARPLVTCAEIGRAVDALTADETLDGVVLAIPSIDTIKMVDDKGLITGTPDRRRVWRAQTPQIFRWSTLMEAYAQPDEVLLGSTDDASLVEALVDGWPLWRVRPRTSRSPIAATCVKPSRS